MADDALLRTVEIAAARAWPASEAAAVGGWLVRRTPRVARARSNSALPPPRTGLDAASAEAAVDAVTAWYRERGALPQIQISPLAWHADLDARLAARGWAATHGADVLVADVATVLAAGPVSADAVLEARPTAAWLGAWGAGEGREAASCAAHGEEILAQVVPRATFARTAVTSGVCIRDPGIAGIFCMATHPAHRRRGLAGALLRALAADAAAHGVERLYLQIDARNDEAAGLYAAHGFVRSHSYVFRSYRA